MRLLGPKHSKDEGGENLDYLKIKIWEKYLQKGIWEIIFKNWEEKTEDGTWPFSCMPKVAMQANIIPVGLGEPLIG